MNIHELKTHPEPFQAVVSGAKRFEFRKDDRTPRFEPGDILRLQEFDPESGYTGHSRNRIVTYIARGPNFGIPEGYCVMSLG